MGATFRAAFQMFLDFFAEGAIDVFSQLFADFIDGMQAVHIPFTFNSTCQIVYCATLSWRGAGWI